MSRLPFYIVVWLFSSLIPSIGFAEDEAEKEDSNASDSYKEFEGIDMSGLSKEELISPLEGIELPEEGSLKVAVIPIQKDIGNPVLYVLRRSLKDAMTAGVDVVVLDMDTPGGRLDITLEIMEILNEFEGITITYINDEAISAGAIISSVTDYIYFSKLGIMGAAAAVASSGQEIPETMQAKINSYLDARIESYSQDKELRNNVIKAMMEKEFEFVEDGILISPKGELLSLTASKAVVPFGDPPERLIAAGIADSIEEIFKYGFGAEEIEITEFEASWSEEVASYIDFLTPVLFGLGIVMFVVELKTPSFGLLGLLGVSFILVALFGHHSAGLAGFEALVLLVIGMVFVAVELFLLPGVMVFGLLGVLCVLGAMVWSLADVWPVVPEPGAPSEGWKINFESLEEGAYNLAISLAIATAVLFIIWRYLPKAQFFRRIMAESTVADPDMVTAGGGRYVEGDKLPDVGTEGLVVTDLRPIGIIEIDGKRYEATISVGKVKKGEKVTVVGYKSYSLLVDRKN